jgi:vacuolar protein sorting-associated protein 52
MNDLIVYSHEDEEIISDSEGSEYGESSTIGTTMEEELSSELSSFSNDPAIAEVLNKNVNLADYSTVLEEQLAESEKICVEAYAGKSKSLAKLQTNIDDCDNILAGMQEMLLGFQADLSGISDEIKHLQEESMTMGVKVRMADWVVRMAD